MRRSLLSFLSSALLVVLGACTITKVSGPSTEQGNPQIAVVVIDSQRRPVAGAQVIAYLINSDTSMGSMSLTNKGLRLTDIHGACRFDSLEKGIYSLWAEDSGQKMSGLTPNIVVAEPKLSRTDTDTIAVTAPGAIRGVVVRGNGLTNQNLKNGDIRVKINEIDRFTITGSDGKYFFDKLPAGVYTLYYYANDFYTSTREKIAVISGQETAIDTVIVQSKPQQLLPPQGFKAVYDTLGAIVRLQWQKVPVANVRWYRVDRFDLSTSPSIINQTICQDTLMSDTVAAFAAGARLNYAVYAVYSINQGIVSSATGAGPLEIIIAAKNKTMGAVFSAFIRRRP